MACGSHRDVKIYDMEKAACEARFALRSDPCGATSVTVGEISRGGNVFAVGCQDGIVRIYDKRCSAHDSIVRVLSEHRGMILGLGAPAENRVISASTAGEVKIWDIAGKRPDMALRTLQYEGLSSFAVHKNASIMACGSPQSIDIFTHDGEKCRPIRSSFLGQRFSSVSSLAFHPYRLLLTTSFRDSMIYIYTAPRK